MTDEGVVFLRSCQFCYLKYCRSRILIFILVLMLQWQWSAQSSWCWPPLTSALCWLQFNSYGLYFRHKQIKERRRVSENGLRKTASEGTDFRWEIRSGQLHRCFILWILLFRLSKPSKSCEQKRNRVWTRPHFNLISSKLRRLFAFVIIVSVTDTRDWKSSWPAMSWWSSTVWRCLAWK